MPLPWETADASASRLPWETGGGAAPTTAKASRLPWERPDARPRLPWETPDPVAPPETSPIEAAPEPPQEEGLLSKLGYALDTPGSYFRGAISGHLGERRSGQQLLEDWGLADKSDEPASIFSGKGLAGLGVDILADPLNLALPGINALTKGGRAAVKVSAHLEEANKLAKAAKEALHLEPVLQATGKAQEAIKAATEHPYLGNLLDAAGNVISDEEKVARMAKLEGPLGDAARVTAKPMGGFKTALSPEWGQQVAQGDRALLSVGGPNVFPYDIAQWGAKKLGATLPDIPQATLLEGAGVSQGLQNLGRGISKIPAIAAASKLFTHTPAEQVAQEALRTAEGSKAWRTHALEEAYKLIDAGKHDEAEAILQKVFPGGMESLAKTAEELKPLETPAAHVPFTPPEVPNASEIGSQIEAGGPGGGLLEGAPERLRVRDDAQAGLEALKPEVQAGPLPIGRGTEEQVAGVGGQEAVKTPAFPFPEGAPHTPPAFSRAEHEAVFAKPVKELTDEEKNYRLLHDRLTGLPNNEAFMADAAAQAAPVKFYADLNGLGYYNKFSRGLGDTVLKTVADTIREAGLNPYKLGDQADEIAGGLAGTGELSKLEAAHAALRGKEIIYEEGGRKITVNGIDFSHGTGQTLAEADRANHAAKDTLYKPIYGEVDTTKGLKPPGLDLRVEEKGLQGGREGILSAPAAGGGAKPPWEPPATASAIPAPEFKPGPVSVKSAQADAKSIGIKAPSKVIPATLSPDLAQKTVELFRAIKGFTPEEGGSFLRQIEHGGELAGPIEEKFIKPIQDWHQIHDTLIKFENENVGVSKLVSERGLGYAAHVGTPEGLAALREGGKDTKAFYSALESKLSEMGVKPATFKAGEIEGEVKAFLDEGGLTKEYQAAVKGYRSPVHPSALARSIRELGIDEINTIAQEHLGHDLFSADPAKVLATRQIRHAVARAPYDFVNGLLGKTETGIAPRGALEGVGQEVGSVLRGTPVKGMEGVEAVPGGFTAPALNAGRPGKSVVFKDAEQAQVASRIYTRMTSPDEINPLLQWYDKTTQLFKGYMTRGFPAFQFRNRYLGHRIQAWMIDDVPYAGDHYANGQKLIAGRDFSFKAGDGQILNRQQLMDEGLKAGMTANGSYEDLLGTLAKGAQDKGSWNPFVPHNKIIDTAERVSAGIISAPGAVLSGVPEAALHATGESLYEADRWGAYIYKRAQGFTPADAFKAVEKTYFDYTGKSLTQFEKDYARRMVFFYNYTRNIIPRMLEVAATKPQKLLPFAHLTQQPGETSPYAPPWASRDLGLPLGTDEKGNPRTLRNLSTPLESAIDPFSEFQGGVKEGLSGLLSLANPIIRVPIERATGKDLFLGKDIADVRKAPHWVDGLPPEVKKALGAVDIQNKDGSTRTEMDPDVLYLLRNSPLSRVSNTASRAEDDSKSLADKLINTLTGASIVSVDVEREKAMYKRNAIIEKLKELERTGRVQEIPNLFKKTSADTGEGAQFIKQLSPSKKKMAVK